MKRTFKYAIAAVLSVGLAVPAFAQESFPDVQDSHWAADAVKRLKIMTFLQGAPGGNFEGQRSVSRYEMASLVYAVYAKLVCFNEEVDKRIKVLEERINNTKVDAPVVVDNSDVIKGLNALKSEVGTIRSWGSDLQILKQMTGKYASELKSLGMDAGEMRKQIDALSARVSALEKKTNAVNISGDANFFLASNFQAAGFGAVINQDGRFASGNANGAGIDTLKVLHELGLNIASPSTAENPWGAELVVGNMLSDGTSGFANTTTAFNGTDYAEGPSSVFLNRAWVKVPKYNALVGRQGLKLGSFIAQRFDNTSFFTNDRYDNGEHTIDGVTVNIAGINAFVGTFNQVVTTENGLITPIVLNGLAIERAMGASYDFKFLNKGKITGTYVNFDGAAAGTNRYEVYGADLGYDFDRFTLTGGWGRSAGRFGTGTSSNNNNERWNVGVNFNADAAKIKLGLQRVEQNYFAPGDWGRVAIFRNLTGVSTASAEISLPLTGKLGLMGSYQRGDALVGNGEFDSWMAGLQYPLTSKWNATVSHEATTFDNGFQGLANNAFARFSTLGLDYNLAANTLFRLNYQYADVNGLVNTPGLGAAQRGGFMGAQLSIRF